MTKITASAHYDINEGCGSPSGFHLYASFDTAEERDAFVRSFPKFCNIKSGAGYGYGPSAFADVAFNANRANGGKNETGVKRTLNITRVLEDYEFNWATPALNSYRTLDGFLAAL